MTQFLRLIIRPLLAGSSAPSDAQAGRSVLRTDAGRDLHDDDGVRRRKRAADLGRVEL